MMSEKVIHIELLDEIDRATAKNIFEKVGAHVLSFNDPRVRQKSLSAVLLDPNKLGELESHIISVNQQMGEQYGYKIYLHLVQ